MAISNFPQSGGPPDNPQGTLTPQGIQPGTSFPAQYQTANQGGAVMPPMSGGMIPPTPPSLPPVMAAGQGLPPPLPAGQPPMAPQAPVMGSVPPQPRGMGLLGSPMSFYQNIASQVYGGQRPTAQMMAGPFGNGPPQSPGLGGAWPAAFSPSAPQFNPSMANALLRSRT